MSRKEKPDTEQTWMRLGATREQARRLLQIPRVELTDEEDRAAWKEHRVTNMWPGALQWLESGSTVVMGRGMFVRAALPSASPSPSAGTAQEPLACPFCGGRAYATRTVNGTQMFKVGCASCGIEMKAARYRDAATPTKDILSLWNQRTPADAAGTPQRTFWHRCSGCGLRWSETEAGSVAAELCGDCWRKVQPILHGDAAGTPK